MSFMHMTRMLNAHTLAFCASGARGSLLPVAQLGCLHEQVVAFGEARGALCRTSVVSDGPEVISAALEQMCAHRVEAVMLCDPRIAAYLSEAREPSGGAIHHGDRDRMVQRHHGVV